MNTPFFDKYKKLPAGKYHTPETAKIYPEDAVLVGMSASGITNAKSLVPCLGVANLDPCTGLALWNKKTKQLATSHEPYMGAEVFKSLLGMIRKNSADVVEAHIIGVTDDMESSERTESLHRSLDKICQAIDATPNVIIKTFDVGNKPHPSAFMVDSRNGKLIRGTEDVYPAQEYDYPESFTLNFEVTDKFFDGTTEEFSKKPAKKDR
jgi:hypothetical protein